MWVIYVLSLIYVIINTLLVGRLSYFKRYTELRNEYWKEYIDFLKRGLNMSSEEIESKRKRLNEMLLEQLKLSMIIFSIYILIFGLMITTINVISPEHSENHPYGDFCIVDGKYIYEKGVYKQPDLFQDKVIEIEGSKFVCQPVLILPFSIFNLKYVIGNLKIFILFIIINSLLLAILKKLLNLKF